MRKTLSVLFILMLAGCSGGYHHQKATDDQNSEQTCQTQTLMRTAPVVIPLFRACISSMFEYIMIKATVWWPSN